VTESRCRSVCCCCSLDLCQRSYPQVVHVLWQVCAGSGTSGGVKRHDWPSHLMGARTTKAVNGTGCRPANHDTLSAHCFAYHAPSRMLASHLDPEVVSRNASISGGACSLPSLSIAELLLPLLSSPAAPAPASRWRFDCLPPIVHAALLLSQHAVLQSGTSCCFAVVGDEQLLLRCGSLKLYACSTKSPDDQQMRGLCALHRRVGVAHRTLQ
jgi:hypothetical protein